MKNTIKFAALGVCALAASSTAALATSTLPAGITTGLALGAPLPEGVYDVTIASYGSSSLGGDATNLAYAIPVWLIWSTPWQIAGGRVQFSSATAIADVWYNDGETGYDSWLNTLVDVGLKWNLGNGWNFGLVGGAWIQSDQLLPGILGRNYTAFQGYASLSYVKNGWNLTATAIYGTGGGGHIWVPYEDDTTYDSNYQPDWLNLDLTATRKFGKMEIGMIAYGAWDLTSVGREQLTHDGEYTAYDTKESEFAVGGLVGYDFGSFVGQFKLAADVEHQIGGEDVAKEVRGTITIIKPLWNPEAAPLK
jgi:hypothetical protein